MWFDTRPKLSTGVVVNPEAALADKTSSLAMLSQYPPKLDCLCGVRLLNVKVFAPDRITLIKDLISAFGACTTTLQDETPDTELSVYFYDSRDALKAINLLSKFAEFRDCLVSPIEQDLKALQIVLPPELTKEELWYEVSKHGDIAWSNFERMGSKFIVTYLLFDIRCNLKLTKSPLMLNGSCVHVREKVVPHHVACRFLSKGSENTTATTSTFVGGRRSGLGSPILIPSFSSSSLYSSGDNTASVTSPPVLSVDSRKPSFLDILASPPHTESSSESTPYSEDLPQQKGSRLEPGVEFMGPLTPPLQQDCKSFTPAVTPPAEKKAAAGTSQTPATPMTPATKSNKVDLNLISSGAEFRTTVMLRNIPNKVNLAALRRFLDETNKNTYDFLYLRMDFNNKCNVGYAFINFTHPDHIATLTRARRGKKWTQYNSVKIIDVSFANIQGRSALVEKFRDSPIMNMDPEYRPKLYHTSGELAGQEEVFP